MKIVLRAISDSDSEKLFEWVNDRELKSYTDHFHPVSEAEHKAWFNSVFHRKDQVLFGIEDNDKKLLIGTCGLFELDFVSRQGELRIKLGDKNYWGSGAGTQAVLELVRFGFQDLNMNRIWLKVMTDNVRAIRSYEKAGFKSEGTLRRAMFINREYKDITLMALLAEEYR